ncbi:MAG TPA: ChaN family lipoprotein [Ignavibacteriaceae bacterium]|nr:ChaN family lipoprotein [Ignavibacteriaceae bacterium]
MKVLTILVLLPLLIGSGLAQDFDSERLPIGDINRKYDFCTVKLNKIFDTKAGKEITYDDMISELKNYRIVMVGESHTNQLDHDVELSVIKGLYEAGKPVVLALEMYNPKQDEALADWVSGKTDPNTFMEQTDYLTTWGHNYRYYKAIFDYAREKHIPMFGVNTEKKYTSKIGRSGVASLTEEDLKAIPKIDTTDIEHKFLIKVLMQGMDATMPDQFNNMYPAQSLWDAAMGEGAIRTAEKYPEATVVLLAGSGHVIYNNGIGKIIQKRSSLSFASVVPVDIPEKNKEEGMMQIRKEIKKEKTDDNKTEIPHKEGMQEKEKLSNPHMLMMSDETPYKIVVKSYADFIWGVKEVKEELYPAFGFSIKDEPQDGGYLVERVMPKTIAFENGLKRNDIILSIDGKTFENSTQLKKYLQFKNWDEQMSFSLLRGDEQVDLSFVIKPVKDDE